MQQIDFTEGGYINPAFTDTLDAYSDTITGYALPARPARWSTTTQIYEGTNQIQRMVMARQLLKELSEA